MLFAVAALVSAAVCCCCVACCCVVSCYCICCLLLLVVACCFHCSLHPVPPWCGCRTWECCLMRARVWEGTCCMSCPTTPCTLSRGLSQPRTAQSSPSGLKMSSCGAACCGGECGGWASRGRLESLKPPPPLPPHPSPFLLHPASPCTPMHPAPPCTLHPPALPCTPLHHPSCKFVIGLAVFTGADTKIMKNQRPTPSKQVPPCPLHSPGCILYFCPCWKLAVGTDLGCPPPSPRSPIGGRASVCVVGGGVMASDADLAVTTA